MPDLTTDAAVGWLSLIRMGALFCAVGTPLLLLAWVGAGGVGQHRRTGPRGVLIVGLLLAAAVLVAGFVVADLERMAAAAAPESSRWLLTGAPLIALVVLSWLLVRDVRHERRG